VYSDSDVDHDTGLEDDDVDEEYASDGEDSATCRTTYVPSPMEAHLLSKSSMNHSNCEQSVTGRDCVSTNRLP
jgi:hypothetical protein